MESNINDNIKNEKEVADDSKNHINKESVNETEDQYSNSSFSPESKNDDYQIRSQNDSYECPGAPQHPTINDSTPTPQRISSFSNDNQNNDFTAEYHRSSTQSYPSMTQFVPVSPDMTNSDAGPSPSTPMASFSQTQYYGVSEYNEYEFRNKVGEGTFGVVHTAKDSRTKEIVAMKHIFMQNENEGVLRLCIINYLNTYNTYNKIINKIIKLNKGTGYCFT